MKKRILAVVSLIMCAVMLFASCGKEKVKKEEDSKENTEKQEITVEEIKAKLAADSNLVAFVDDVAITQADFNFMYKLSYDNMSQYSMSYGAGWYNAEVDDDGTTIGDYMKKSAIEAVVELIAVEKIAKEHGVSVDTATIDEQFEIFKQQQGGDSGYKKFIEDYRTTEEAIRKYFERAMLYNKLSGAFIKEGSSEYEKLVSDFNQSYMCVQHILISAQNGRSDTDALKIAKEVIKKLGEGADFDSLIDEYNEDPGMTSGNYYTFTDGTMVQEFEEASKKLNVGEYTKTPVKSKYGYHIIKKYELTTNCEEFEKLKMEKAKVKINEALNEKKNSVHIEKNEGLIDSNIEAWMKDLGVDTSAQPTVTPIQ